MIQNEMTDLLKFYKSMLKQHKRNKNTSAYKCLVLLVKEMEELVRRNR